ncbi:MAG: M50 family metallopeptidase [Thermodesulfobacteriota bacterium]
MAYLIHLLEAILAVNALVLVHEAGHLLVARAFRVPSLRFCLGLGPRLFGLKYKGTDYCVAAVPIGGFVQLAQDHRHDNRTSCMDCVSAWKRMLIFFAGPAANLLFVVFLFWLVYCVIGLRDHQPVVAAVEPGSAEAIAGIEPEDRILQVDGSRVITWSQLALALEKEGPGSVTLVVQRPGMPEGSGFEAREMTRVLSVSLDGQQTLGILPTNQMILLRLGPFRALEKSVNKLWLLSGILVDSLVGLVTAKVPPSELVGPIYLFHLSSKAASAGPASLVYLLAFISASLCFFNLLPLPVLDGGQILLAFLQKVLQRPIGDRSLRLLMHASLFWLFLLLASATLNDLVRLLAT